MSKARKKAVGFRLKPLGLKVLKSVGRKRDFCFDQHILPLKRGGQNFIAVASAKLAKRKFGSQQAYHAALKAAIAGVKADGSANACEQNFNWLVANM